jgi:catechol 2,3-dioxygenase-like lactoylglutathione lyase family enzyme
MKRFHVNLSVANLAQSRQFYTGLFGTEPAVSKDDYAKWMLEDPRLNFSITQSSSKRGIQHIGLQADTVEELAEISATAGRRGDGRSARHRELLCDHQTWCGPDDVAWETFVTHEQIANFGSEPVVNGTKAASKRCCA